MNFYSAFTKQAELYKGKRLLLHSCCAPCSSAVLELLCPIFEVSVLYYNPNIFPEEEYLLRKNEQIRFLDECCKSAGFIDCDSSPSDFYEAVNGYEHEKEGGSRCELCFGLRLLKTAETAVQKGFDLFGTTLTVSPHKNAEAVNAAGLAAQEKTGAVFLVADFKKKDGYKRSLELSRKFNLYRQNYCGCEFSKK